MLNEQFHKGTGSLVSYLLPELSEDLVPVGSSSVGPRLEASDEVAVLLLVHQVKRQLQPHRLHVSLLQGRRDVPVNYKSCC